MSTDTAVLADVDAAFAASPRRQRFTPLVADPEDEDHEALLTAEHSVGNELAECIRTWQSALA